jgi:signal transduction histidine kinase
MRQVFQNIISNSLKFVQANVIPKITITYEILNGNEIERLDESRLNEKILKIRIRDNGIGFNQDYSSKIFTIFKRLNNNSLYKGTGIGLAICKKVIENHNGFITAESNLPKEHCLQSPFRFPIRKVFHSPDLVVRGRNYLPIISFRCYSFWMVHTMKSWEECSKLESGCESKALTRFL